jgi:hypothetical protein
MERVTLYLHRHKLRPYLQQVKTENNKVYRIAKNELGGCVPILLYEYGLLLASPGELSCLYNTRVRTPSS